MLKDCDIALYEFLYNEFQNEHYHVEFTPDSCSDPSNYPALIESIKRLFNADVLIIIYEGTDCIQVELDYRYAYDLIDLTSL